MNGAIKIAVGAIAMAQIIKIPYTFHKTKRWEFNKLLGTGGMPSSHSSGVTALATYVGWEKGWDSIDFAIASMLGLIVMYDAAGIRRHAGEIAIQVNDLDADVELLAGNHPGIYHLRREEKLKESLGHQPIEVLAGAVLGIGIGTISYLVKSKKKKHGFARWLDVLH